MKLISLFFLLLSCIPTIEAFDLKTVMQLVETRHPPFDPSIDDFYADHHLDAPLIFLTNCITTFNSPNRSMPMTSIDSAGLFIKISETRSENTRTLTRDELNDNTKNLWN